VNGRVGLPGHALGHARAPSLAPMRVHVPGTYAVGGSAPAPRYSLGHLRLWRRCSDSS